MRVCCLVWFLKCPLEFAEVADVPQQYEQAYDRHNQHCLCDRAILRRPKDPQERDGQHGTENRGRDICDVHISRVQVKGDPEETPESHEDPIQAEHHAGRRRKPSSASETKPERIVMSNHRADSRHAPDPEIVSEQPRYQPDGDSPEPLTSNAFNAPTFPLPFPRMSSCAFHITTR